MSDPLHRIEMIDTETMVLGQLWQKGVGNTSVLLDMTRKLLAERKELEEQLGYKVLNKRMANEV